MHLISFLLMTCVVAFCIEVILGDGVGQFLWSCFVTLAWIVFFIWLAIHLYSVTH